MAKFKLFIEYAGTRYSGWQIQRNARTVQGELTRVIADVTGQRQFELYGSGRTVRAVLLAFGVVVALLERLQRDDGRDVEGVASSALVDRLVDRGLEGVLVDHQIGLATSAT